MLNPAAYGVALGLGAIGVEYVVARRMGRASVYRFSSTISNIACAFGSQAVALVVPPTTMLLYRWVYERWALWHLPTALAWAIGILGVDVLYYWCHRFSHEWSFLWGAHAVHHHSEDFNSTVSAREPYLGLFMLAPFFLPLAVVGVPPIVYLVGVAMHVVFGFFEHTQLVGRLPRPFEWLFATPSNHRVHHAVNPEYVDRNYGAIFMIWDRLFGTYEPERAACVFGVTKPIRSMNPIWANLEHWVRVLREVRAASDFRTRLRIFFGPPSRTPEPGATASPENLPAARRLEVPTPPLALKVWILLQLVLVAAVLVVALLRLDALSAGHRWVAAGFVVLSSISLAALIERKAFAWPLETLRLVAFSGFLLAVR